MSANTWLNILGIICLLGLILFVGVVYSFCKVSANADTLTGLQEWQSEETER